jgi:hypothetical protein
VPKETLSAAIKDDVSRQSPNARRALRNFIV